jgi:hypothetical protein
MLARMWGKKEPSHTAGGNEKYGLFLKKLNIDLLYDTAILLLGIYLKECDSGNYKGISRPMFMAALFTVAKLWRQPRCLITDR